MNEAPQSAARSPLVLGARCTLHIQDIAFGGEGVGRVGECVVFVPFVIVGETIEAEIVEMKRSFARARLLRVVAPSPDRVTPRCQYFGDCGGCQYQHMAYARQVEMKRKQVADLFQRIGGLDPAVVQPVVPCPRPYQYRNRIMIRSQWDKYKQGLNIGFIRYDNRLVVDIEECHIAEPALSEQIRTVRAHPPPKGGLKVVLRIPPEDWDLPRDSFFQNNFYLLPELVRTVRAAVSDSGIEHLIDVYCGVGFFALELAGQVASFAGVELDRPAVEAARHNAAARSISNGEFILGRAEDELPRLLARFEAARTAVLLDPPRTGCPRPSLEQLRAVRPRQILYVSCHPATLARDLKILTADGAYAVRGVTPLDMFPQTQHVECVADLRAAPITA